MTFWKSFFKQSGTLSRDPELSYTGKYEYVNILVTVSLFSKIHERQGSSCFRRCFYTSDESSNYFIPQSVSRSYIHCHIKDDIHKTNICSRNKRNLSSV
jgi:hypothetical protein